MISRGLRRPDWLAGWFCMRELESGWSSITARVLGGRAAFIILWDSPPYLIGPTPSAWRIWCIIQINYRPLPSLVVMYWAWTRYDIYYGPQCIMRTTLYSCLTPASCFIHFSIWFMRPVIFLKCAAGFN